MARIAQARIVRVRFGGSASSSARGLAKKIWRPKINGRGDRIRTCDIYVPNVALYQSELHPERTRPCRNGALIVPWPGVGSAYFDASGCGVRGQTARSRAGVCAVFL